MDITESRQHLESGWVEKPFVLALVNSFVNVLIEMILMTEEGSLFQYFTIDCLLR